MKIREPEVVNISKDRIWIGRQSVNGFFVQRHNLTENLDRIKIEVDKNKITVEPDDWLLLLEGKRKYLARENLYLDELIQDFRLKSEDPIISPFTQEIAHKVSIEKSLAALSALIMEYVDFVDQAQGEIEEERLRRFLDETLHFLAKSFDVSPAGVQKLFMELRWKDDGFWEEVTELSKKRQRLIDESNSQSKTRLVGVLGENKEPNIFIMAGISHRPVFT